MGWDTSRSLSSQNTHCGISAHYSPEKETSLLLYWQNWKSNNLQGKEGRWGQRWLLTLNDSSKTWLKQPFSNTICSLCKISNSSFKSMSKMGFSATLCTDGKTKWMVLYLTALFRCLLSQGEMAVLNLSSSIYSDRKKLWHPEASRGNYKMGDRLDKTLKILSVITWNFGLGLTDKLAMTPKLKIHLKH